MSDEVIASVVGAVLGGVVTLVIDWLRSFRRPRRGRRGAASIVALVLGGALVGFAGFRAYEYIQFERAVGRQVAAYESLVRAALSSNTDRAYIIPVVVARWQIEKRITAAGPVLEAEPRTTYVVHALRSISAESGVFQERYDTDDAGGTVLALPATERSTRSRHSTRSLAESWINVEMASGTSRALVTGARYTWAPGSGPAAALFPKTGANEGEFCYPTGSDLVGELLIYVESTTLGLALNPTGGASARVLRANRDTADVRARLYTEAGSQRRLAAARFDLLGTEAEACLKVWW